jgi:transcriptional regulator with XRE-family HTH domain
MSQKALAEELGITFQQIQKFERGMNRIAAGRLHGAARALDVPISYFFDALPTALDGRATPPRGLLPAEAWNEMENDTLHSRETLKLVRAYHTVPDPTLRKRILDLVRSLAPAH